MPELFRKLKIMRDRLGAHNILFGTDMSSIPEAFSQDKVGSDLRRTQQWVQLFKNLISARKNLN